MNYELAVIYPFLIIFGACIGSFINVVISRLPIKGAFLSNTRSCCPECGEPIKAYDLIPILSWLILKGRCRNCDTCISARYPAVELTVALLAAASYCHFGMHLSAITAFCVTTVLLAISIIDIKTTEIPDSLVIAVGVFAIAAIWMMPDVTILSRFIGLVCISVPMLIIAVIVSGAFGGGDIKLIAACGFLLGWQSTILAFFIAVVTEGCLSSVLTLRHKVKKGAHIAFGPHLCAGVIVALLYGEGIITRYLGLFRF